jgi:hypothetical protein
MHADKVVPPVQAIGQAPGCVQPGDINQSEASVKAAAEYSPPYTTAVVATRIIHPKKTGILFNMNEHSFARRSMRKISIRQASRRHVLNIFTSRSYGGPESRVAW